MSSLWNRSSEPSYDPRSSSKSRYDDSISALTTEAIQYNQPGDSGGDLQRVTGAVHSSRAFISSHRHQSNDEDEQQNQSLRTFRHQINVPPLEKQKRMSRARGDYVYEAIAKKSEVPTWLQTLADSPAKEAREVRYRPENIEVTLTLDGEVAKKEYAEHPEYIPPHHDPLPNTLVDRHYWKHNKRTSTQPVVSEVKKRRVEIHSSEIPHLDPEFRPDGDKKRRERRRAAHSDREHRHKRKHRMDRHRSRSSSSSENDESRAPVSFLSKEVPRIRDNPAIIAGGSATVGRRARTPPHVRELERQASPSYAGQYKPVDLSRFRSSPPVASPMSMRPAGVRVFRPVTASPAPVPVFKPVPVHYQPASFPLAQTMTPHSVHFPANPGSLVSRGGHFQDPQFVMPTSSPMMMQPPNMPYSTMPVQAAIRGSGVQHLPSDAFVNKMAHSIPDLRTYQHQTVRSVAGNAAPAPMAVLPFMQKNQDTAFSGKDGHLRNLISRSTEAVSDPTLPSTQVRPNTVHTGGPHAPMDGAIHIKPTSTRSISRSRHFGQPSNPSNLGQSGTFVLPTRDEPPRPSNSLQASNRILNTDRSAEAQHTLNSDGITADVNGISTSSPDIRQRKENLEGLSQMKYVKPGRLTLSARGSENLEDGRSRKGKRATAEEIDSSVPSNHASPVATRKPTQTAGIISAMPTPGISRAGSQASAGYNKFAPRSARERLQTREEPSSPRTLRSSSGKRALPTNGNSNDSSSIRSPDTPATSESNPRMGGKFNFDMGNMKSF